jgi:hypothetical protein
MKDTLCSINSGLYVLRFGVATKNLENEGTNNFFNNFFLAEKVNIFYVFFNKDFLSIGLDLLFLKSDTGCKLKVDTCCQGVVNLCLRDNFGSCLFLLPTNKN